MQNRNALRATLRTRCQNDVHLVFRACVGFIAVNAMHHTRTEYFPFDRVAWRINSRHNRSRARVSGCVCGCVVNSDRGNNNGMSRHYVLHLPVRRIVGPYILLWHPGALFRQRYPVESLLLARENGFHPFACALRRIVENSHSSAGNTRVRARARAHVNEQLTFRRESFRSRWRRLRAGRSFLPEESSVSGYYWRISADTSCARTRFRLSV